MATDPFVILTICTGNIHRSPTAQYLLAHAFRAEPGIAVVSAGTGPALGEPMGDTLADFLRGEGIDASDFRARFLTAGDVRDADLVLGMTRAHRGQAVSLWPGALRRSFTLKEFARVAARVPAGELAAAGEDSAARLAALADLAARRRAPASAEDDDIVDPQGQGDFIKQRVFVEIVEAVETIVRTVRVRRGRRAL